jgi:hypothetical protein
MIHFPNARKGGKLSLCVLLRLCAVAAFALSVHDVVAVVGMRKQPQRRKDQVPGKQSPRDKAQESAQVAAKAANVVESAVTALISTVPGELATFNAKTVPTTDMESLSIPSSLNNLSSDVTSSDITSSDSTSSDSNSSSDSSSSLSSSSDADQNLGGSNSSDSSSVGSSSSSNALVPTGLSRESSSSSSSSSSSETNLTTGILQPVVPHRKFDLSVLEEVELYRLEVETGEGTATTFRRAVRVLLTERGSETYLKARPVLQSRIEVWKLEFQKMGFMASNAMCAKLVLNKSGAQELWIFVSLYVHLIQPHTHCTIKICLYLSH